MASDLVRLIKVLNSVNVHSRILPALGVLMVGKGMLMKAKKKKEFEHEINTKEKSVSE